MGRVEAEWTQTAIEELIAGRRASWDTVLERSRERLTSIAPPARPRGRSGPSPFPTPTILERYGQMRRPRVVTSMAEASGKRLGIVVPKELKGRVYLKDDVLVDGEGAL